MLMRLVLSVTSCGSGGRMIGGSSKWGGGFFFVVFSFHSFFGVRNATLFSCDILLEAQENLFSPFFFLLLFFFFFEMQRNLLNRQIK